RTIAVLLGEFRGNGLEGQPKFSSGRCRIAAARPTGLLSLGGFGVKFVEDSGQFGRAAIAKYGELDLSPRQRSGDLVSQHISVVDLFAVDGRDYITAADTGFIGGAARTDITYQYAGSLRQVESLCRVARDILDVDAEHPAAYAAVGQELIHYALCHVRRDRKADTDVSAGSGRRKYLRVYPDKFTV